MAAEFKTGVLTAEGKALLAKWQAGGITPEITRAAVGSGSYSKTEDVSTRTELKSQKLSVGISSETVGEDTLSLRFVFSNETLTTGFSVTEVGIFAMDPTKGEILYSIAVSADESVADFFPAYSGNHSVQQIFDYYLKISNAENVVIQAGSGAYALADDMRKAKADITVLQSRTSVIEFMIAKKYGVRRAVGASSPAWERLGDAVGLTANAAVGTEKVDNDFMASVYPYCAMRPCNLGDNGVVNAYLGDADFAWDGSNGDAMLEVPVFFSDRYLEQDETDGKTYEYRWISPTSIGGLLKADPLFWEDATGEEYKSRVYLPIFPGSLSEDGKTLRSIAGTFPAVSRNRKQFRTLCRAKGTGWSLDDVWSAFALEHLYLVMFANSNAQNILGSGRTSMSYDGNCKALYDAEASNTITITTAQANNFLVGQAVGCGTSTGNTSKFTYRLITSIKESETSGESVVTFDGSPVDIVAGNVLWSCCQPSGETTEMASPNGTMVKDAKHAVRFLWIEDWFGNVWQQMDGDNIRDWVHYLCHVRNSYDDSVYSGDYVAIGYSAPSSNGYVKELGYDPSEPMAGIISEAGGDSSTFYADYYWQNSGERVPYRGGNVYSGGNAGPFCWSCYDAWSTSYWVIGGRPLYK
ncbi:MAG: phage tail protein [Faecalibacterium sp.]